MKNNSFGERLYIAATLHERYDQRQVFGMRLYRETGMIRTAARLAICTNGVLAWRQAARHLSAREQTLDTELLPAIVLESPESPVVTDLPAPNAALQSKPAAEDPSLQSADH